MDIKRKYKTEYPALYRRDWQHDDIGKLLMYCLRLKIWVDYTDKNSAFNNLVKISIKWIFMHNWLLFETNVATLQCFTLTEKVKK